MGYTTNFKGSFELDHPLSSAHKVYLDKFSETRRMKRDANLTKGIPDPLRLAAGLDVGVDGGYFVGADKEHSGQEYTSDIINYNESPTDQPSLWCQWRPNEEGTTIVWDEVEKFYGYIEWIEYLIEHFLKPWGYTVHGNVSWQGEDVADSGVIYVKNNRVKFVPDVVVRQEPEWDE